jgi:arabinoxylan arabinofuranohydrolase
VPKRLCIQLTASERATMVSSSAIALLLSACLIGRSTAANPIIKDMKVCKGTDPVNGMCGVADTNVHFFDGRFMIFATHDFNVNNTGYLMKDWQCWSSPDLVAWTLESIIPPTPMKWDPNPDECWATDAAWTAGKYYFYVSAGPGTVGVMVADSPKGPWRDPIGKALMSAELGKSMGATFRDPCVFNEPGTADFYIIAGVFDYFVTKLGKDMVSLAEAPQRVKFTNHVYGPCADGKTADQPFMHKNNGVYFLSWGCFYATGKSVYGPFTMQGSVIDTAKIEPAFQCDGQPHQCGKSASAALAASDRATLPMRARAAALAQHEGPAAR